MKNVDIFTDGACRNNPGPGGWGAILRYGTVEKEISGGCASTTNNQMEMTAVIEALKCLKEPCSVTVYSDSSYVCNGINKGWAKGWKANNWKKSNKEPAKNVDLWEVLLDLTEQHDVKFIWVKGHNGHTENERCDRLATSAADKYKVS